MEQAPRTKPEQEPKPERNLLTNYEATVKAIATVEGLGWHDVQELALRKADKRGITDPDKFIAATERTIHAAKARLENMDAEEREDELHIVHTIEGSGGGDRYEVWSDGTVKFSGFHAKANPDHIRRAQELGFEIQQENTPPL